MSSAAQGLLQPTRVLGVGVLESLNLPKCPGACSFSFRTHDSGPSHSHMLGVFFFFFFLTFAACAPEACFSRSCLHTRTHTHSLHVSQSVYTPHSWFGGNATERNIRPSASASTPTCRDFSETGAEPRSRDMPQPHLYRLSINCCVLRCATSESFHKKSLSINATTDG